MPSDSQIAGYEPVRPPRRAAGRREPESVLPPSSARAEEVSPAGDEFSSPPRETSLTSDVEVARADGDAEGTKSRDAALPLKRGHALTYAGLFLFTFVVYFRPYELVSALAPLAAWLAFPLAVATALFYFPAQLGLEGNLTAPLREVKLVLLLCLFAALSVPLAINRGEAWDGLVNFLKVALVFVMLVNAVRTEARLRRLVLLLLAASVVLSFGAFADYRAGRFNTGGERIAGIVGGMFGNPNDLAMHLSTMVPLAFVLVLSSRALKKMAYAALAVLMAAAVVLTFSRGGFLGLAAGGLVLAWKLGRRHRLLVAATSVFAVAAFVALAPSEYSGRLTTIVDTARDLTGSAGARREILIVSLVNIAKHPLFGVGMNNFHIISIHEQVSHNAYTQVGAELGVPAMIAYVLFLLAPLKRLRRVERETLPPRRSHDYYWAVGLQASIVAYMVSSFFGSVAYLWYIYYLVALAVCFQRIYESKKLTAAATAADGAATGGAEVIDSETSFARDARA
ncbi:MAG: O-antigen ligase family protein [Acidobacteria bacterium]|nr:O-antigen ligase family protein [Acidobacteriota bacterium]MCA1641898.1 O-antigen ligase family protein [Acidobacteriota bacterium]